MFALLALAFASTVIPACSSRTRVEPPVFEGKVLEANAKPDLLQAALLFACSRSEMAILDEQTLDDGTVVFDLVTLRDEPGRVTAVPTDADHGWRIEASIGRLGNAEEESALLARLADRIYRLQQAGQ